MFQKAKDALKRLVKLAQDSEPGIDGFVSATDSIVNGEFDAAIGKLEALKPLLPKLQSDAQDIIDILKR